jgi:ATP-binding cassette subfamily B protein
MRLYDPSEGRILIDGQDIRAFKLESLRQQISVVLQDGLLFSATVRENIALGDPQATDEDIEAAARLANAHDFILSMPDGYETMLAERGVSLSTGQRQRLAIARAALRMSRILILDEPTIGLDRHNEELVIQALRRLAQRRSVLLITHDLEFAAAANSIVYLEGGRVVEVGRHEELLAANGAYAALYRARTAEDEVHGDDPYAGAS